MRCKIQKADESHMLDSRYGWRVGSRKVSKLWDYDPFWWLI